MQDPKLQDPRLAPSSQSGPGGRAASLVIVVLLAILLIVASNAGAATPKPVELAPAAPKTATATVPYHARLSARNGVAPYTYSIESGRLPEGLALGASGEIVGTPTAAGASTFTVKASDSSSPAQAVTRTYTLDVQLDVTPAAMHGVRVEQLFEQALGAAGGDGSYTYRVTSGELPPNVEEAGTRSALSLEGFPTRAGTYRFTVQAQDSEGHTGTRSYTLKIGLGFFPSSSWDIRTQFVGVEAGQTIGAEGGSGEYAYEVVKGALPDGMALVTLHGEAEIAGTPTKAGLYSFTIAATDVVTGLKVAAPVRIPVFSSPLPVYLRHFEEEGQEPGYVSLEPEGERHGVIYGKAFMISYGTFTYNANTGELAIVQFTEGGSVTTDYDASCERATDTCKGTGPNGAFTLHE